MKKIIPFKFIAGLIIFFILIPLTIVLLLLTSIEKGDLIIALVMFLFIGPIAGIVSLIKNDVYILINLLSGQVTNNVFYNMDSWNWTKNIKSAKDIYFTKDKTVIYQLFKRKYRPKKTLVFVFPNQEIKFMPLGLFTKRQIDKITKIIYEIKLCK